MNSSKFIQQSKKFTEKIFDGANRGALSISSWFCVKEEGMTDLEILSRSSGFLVKARDPIKFGRKYHFVTVSHTVAPWRWTKYYPQDWIKALNETHTVYTFETRYNDGNFIGQIDFIPRSYHHKTKDLCVLHIEDENTFVNDLEDLFNIKKDKPLLDNTDFINSDNLLEFHGHDVSEPNQIDLSKQESDKDLRVPIPTIVHGNFTFKTPQQNFAVTEMTLSDGMCGGPVIVRRSALTDDQKLTVDGLIKHTKKPSALIGMTSDYYNGNDNNDKEDVLCVVGMIDGIVPLDHPEEQLRGLASYITAKDIREVLDNIEDGNLTHVDSLVGGQVLDFISSNRQNMEQKWKDLDKFL